MAQPESPVTAVLSPVIVSLSATSIHADKYISSSGITEKRKSAKTTTDDLKPLSSIIDTIGNTPLIHLNNIKQRYGLRCNVYAKLEWLNPSGSIMDRIALYRITQLEQRGILIDGAKIIMDEDEICDPNKAISMALCCAAKRYQLEISETMQNVANQEQKNTLRLLGARVRQDESNGNERDVEEIPNVFMKQTDNENTCKSKEVEISDERMPYGILIEEILNALENDVHLIVLPVVDDKANVGRGISCFVKQRAPMAKVIEVKMKDDTAPGNDSSFSENGQSTGSLFDTRIQVDSGDAYRMARELIHREGLLCGGLSGAMMYAAIQPAKCLNEAQNCIVVLPDGIRNFMSNLLDDAWMMQHGHANDELGRSSIKLPDGYEEGLPVINRPDRLQKCHWSSVNPEENDCPIVFKPWPGAPRRDQGENWRTRKAEGYRKNLVKNSVLDIIGETPLVRLNRIPEMFGVKCEVYAKCESMNPGASVKDRIAFRMIHEAEQRNLLKPGSSTLVEATSGNTGIGLALIAAVKRYRCIITVYNNMSIEKEKIVRALGAEVIRTRKELPLDHSCSRFGIAARLQRDIPDAINLEQFANLANPVAHYDGTAEEILYALDDHVDMFVAGAGTGGTITGTARKFKQACPECQIIGVDPEGSIMADPETTKFSPYEIDGIGLDFVPSTLDRSVVDKWVKCSDREAFQMARRMAYLEGILCGGSSGASIAGAMKAAVKLKEHQRCVVVLPDGINNYMTKFVDEKWMNVRGYTD